MFAANKKVSARQLNRIMITENIGMVCLFSGHMAGVFGNVTYVWLLIVAMFISMAYLWISLKISEVYGEKLLRSKIYNILSAIRFFVMGVAGIYIFYKIVSELLLKTTSALLLIAAIGILCIFVAKCDYEARGRMHEILGIIVLIPIAIILITSTFKVDFAYAERQIAEGFGIPDRENMIMMVIMFLLVTYFEKLIIVKAHYYNTYGNRIKLLKTPLVLWIIAIWVFVVCTCIFGKNATLLKLMDIGGIPGGFLNRQEAVMAVFLVVSLTSYVSGMFSYIRQNVKNVFIRYVKKPRIVTRRIISAVLLVLMIVGAFAVAMRMDSEDKDNDTQKASKVIGGKEIEQWDFIMSMIIDGSGDGVSVILEIAGYGNEGNRYVRYIKENVDIKDKKQYADAMESMEKKYVASGGNVLEFSHIKGIVLKNLDDSETECVVEVLEEDKRFSGNIMVYSTEQNIGENGEFSTKKGFELGKTLEKLGRNVEKYKNSCLYKAGISTDYIMQIDIFTETDYSEK